MDKFLFVIHIVGVALAVGTGFAIVALKMGSADMPKAEREPYMLRGFVTTNIGAIGIVFVLASGLVMFFRDSEALMQKGAPFLWVKLALFVLYLVVFVILRLRVSKARLTNGGPLMINMSKFVIVMNVVGIMLIVSSVLAFHDTAPKTVEPDSLAGIAIPPATVSGRAD